MRIKKIKSKKERTWLLPVLVPVVLLILVALIFGNVKLYQKRRTLTPEMQVLQDKIEELQKEKQGLEARILQAQQEEYLERAAREEFNMKKEGEEVVAFPVVEDPFREDVVHQRSFWEKLREKLAE